MIYSQCSWRAHNLEMLKNLVKIITNTKNFIEQADCLILCACVL